MSRAEEKIMEKKGIWGTIRYALGLYRNPRYIEDRLKEADVRSAMFLSAVVAMVEIWMIVRYIVQWVIPGKVESLAEFFHYTSSFWYFFAAAAALFIYCVLYLKNKFRYLNKISRLLIFAFFAIAMYFGVVTSMKDFAKGRMVTCFLTMMMYVTVICVWRPFTSLILTFVCGFGFVYLLNNFTFDKAGEQVVMESGDLVNYITFILIVIILELAVYFQRYGDASKSYKLQLASVTDTVTGIPNMRKFDSDAEKYTEKCLAEGKNPVYLMFDIANFHTYNDRYGYKGGDELLEKVGHIIVEEFAGEPAARDSADLFVALTSSEDPKARAASVRDKVRAEFPSETYLDVKVGAYAPGDSTNEPRLAADRAGYATKQVRVEECFYREYDEKMNKDHTLRQYVLNNIDEAVKEGYIKVFYQPVMLSEDGTICGCEALARWDDPKIGFLSPGVFIPVLEEGRQIHKLDLCIYEQVCKRLRDCLDKGLPALPASMNFSRLDFELMDAVGELEALVEKYSIPKHHLHVEITESTLTQDVQGLKQAMDRLHKSGYVIWLDDFGSGYSSLNVLKDFDFDLLKIDMEFLKNFNGNENSRKIIGTIIDLAKKLNMETLSEGVETQEAVDFLREAGCGRLQGYFYGKPMPYEDILAKIEDGTYKLA
ncbi:MAG: GGDEF domain-containing protein [Ruminiclostridium sp.]|nr:GGDEF domain-containing protein [Ruminiclostridium sp.]